jgi:hypothetical protein
MVALGPDELKEIQMPHYINTAAAVLSGALWLSVTAPAAAQQVSPELAKLRDALSKYKDPIVAIHDGYFSTLGCVEYPKAGGEGHAPYPRGGMGVHFLNMTIMGPEPDLLRPNVLLYEPDGDQLRLVAAEWFVPLMTGVKQRPSLFGIPFDGPMEGHHPLMPLEMHHYDLHVWLWKDNPEGMFKPTNPTVSCGRYPYSFRGTPPKLVRHP